jgi:hypothetical protein
MPKETEKEISVTLTWRTSSNSVQGTICGALIQSVYRELQ